MMLWNILVTRGLSLLAGLLRIHRLYWYVRVVTSAIPRWPFPEQVDTPPAGLRLNCLTRSLCRLGLKFG